MPLLLAMPVPPFKILQMPPRRSVRRKRPSSQALEALAGANSPPARRRRAAGQIPSSNAEMAPLAANPLVSAEVGNACPDPVLPTGFLEQVVARVTTEVTRQLQPLLSGARTPQSDVALPAESTLPQDSTTVNQTPAAVQSTLSAAARTEVPVVGNPVQQAVNSVQSTLSGEQGLFPSLPWPQDPFTSINLPGDARVAMKLKTKIW